MLRIIALFALVSAISAASIDIESTTEKRVREVIPLVRYETDKKPDGSFSFTFEGGDKSFRQESGTLSNAGTDDEALEITGSYRYIDADGQEVEVHYTAGKNGFVPVGTNILSEISAAAKAAADLPAFVKEEVVQRKSRDADEIIQRQLQKVENKANEKIDIQVAKINKKFNRADEIINEALNF